MIDLEPGLLPAPLRPAARPLVGMVHLLPLPGSPGWAGSMEAVLERAVTDAEALAAGGMDGILVENYGDVPFRRGSVDPWTVAAMTRAVAAVRAAVAAPAAAGTIAEAPPVGVNVLRNDARSALAIAAATGASFIRVNVHTGVAFTDQGVVSGRADRTLRLRRALDLEVAVLADVHVKHATPPPGATLEASARDARQRGLADALIVSGERTGGAVAVDDVRRVKEAVPDAPVWIGSGVTPTNAREMLALADGAIVGSPLHRDGTIGRGIDIERVRELVGAARG